MLGVTTQAQESVTMRRGEWHQRAVGMGAITITAKSRMYSWAVSTGLIVFYHRTTSLAGEMLQPPLGLARLSLFVV